MQAKLNEMKFNILIKAVGPSPKQSVMTNGCLNECLILIKAVNPSPKQSVMTNGCLNECLILIKAVGPSPKQSVMTNGMDSSAFGSVKLFSLLFHFGIWTKQ